ncbi:MAG: ATP-binding protein, partial [Nitrososphaerota archaeon]
MEGEIMGRQEFDVPVDQRIIQQLSTQTVKYPIDAIVELVTNSDDSYKRLEDAKIDVDGYILVVVNYSRNINEIICVDHAEGMTKDELLKNVKFAAETSSFKQHKTVRGLFGRGLKEAIFSLGEGEITTVKGDQVVTLRLYKNNEGKYRGEWLGDWKADARFRKESGIPGNGTIVKIKLLENRRMGNLALQIRQHYALRNILSASNRDVELRLNNTWSKLKYQYPPRVPIVDKSIKLDTNDSIHLIIYESTNPLDSVFEPQVANSGLLVEVEGNILDNTLLGYENEPAALYFSGKIVCDGIANYLRNNDFGVLNADRSGISWRHMYCSRIKEAVKAEFKTVVEKKKQQLERGGSTAVSKTMERGLDRIAEELSKLFEIEVEEEGKLTKNEKTFVAKNMLLIKPSKANVEIGIPRPLTVYVSKDLAEGGVR